MTNKQIDPEEHAMMLLKHVLQLGRNGKPYKNEISELRVALKKAPNTNEYMLEMCKALLGEK